jgi:hypothetical protein
MNRQRTNIKNRILELCAEDDYGSWELWWAITPEDRDAEEADLSQDFVRVVEELVNKKAIIPKSRDSNHKLSVVEFSRKRLKKEIKGSAQPDPDQYYWFGLPDG